MEGEAKVLETKRTDLGLRVSFVFQGLSETDRERLELFIFDVVLSKLG